MREAQKLADEKKKIELDQAPVKLAPGSKGLVQNKQRHSATIIKNLMH